MNLPNFDLRLWLSVAVLCGYTTLFVGCGGENTPTNPAPASDHADDDHDHDGDDHDHDDDGHDHDDAEHAGGHEGHVHAPHGPNGGHMLELSGGTHAEWAHDDAKNQISVFVENPETVSKVEMKTTVADEETVYEFEKAEADGKTHYQIVSPELLTAVKMGEAVKTVLVITTDDGELTGNVEHHAH